MGYNNPLANQYKTGAQTASWRPQTSSFNKGYGPTTFGQGNQQSNFGMSTWGNAAPSGRMQTQGIINNPMQSPSGTAPYSSFGQYAGATDEQRARAQEYAQMQLPYLQYQQGADQYREDFGESQRRWNAEMARNQGLDAWQQQFSGRQQTAAEQQAALAQQNWRDQFGFESEMASRDLSLRNAQQLHQYGVDEANIGMQQQQIKNQAAQHAAEMGFDYASMNQQQRQFMDNLAFQRQQEANRVNLESRGLGIQQQQVTNQARQEAARLGYDYAQLSQQDQQFVQNLAFQKLQNTQQFGLQTREQNLAELQNRQQFGLQQQEFGEGRRQFNVSSQQQQQQINNQASQFASQMGLNYATLDLNQKQFVRQMALEELRNRQQFGQQQQEFGEGRRQFNIQTEQQAAQFAQTLGVDYSRLSQQEQEFVRSQAQQQQQFRQTLSFQQMQQQQQIALERARLAEQARQANQAIWGRNQAANARWMRRA